MGISLFGFSHLDCLEAGYQELPPGAPECRFVFLKDEEFGWERGNAKVDLFQVDNIRTAVESAGADDLLCVSIRGNEHVVASLANLKLKPDVMRTRIERKLDATFPWLDMFAGFGRRVLVLPPPPPMPAAHIQAHPRRFAERLKEHGISPPDVRIAAWKHQVALLRAKAAELGMEFLEMPQEVFSPDGLLRVELAANDPSHGNAQLGKILLARIFEIAGAQATAKKPAAAPASPAATPAAGKQHPYKGLPDSAFWKESVASVPAATLDPVHQVPFQIGRADKVATAGSCFAQHISKQLRKGGFHFLVTEQPGAGVADAEQRGFHDFSARYGNIYTSRQLVQLFDRAFGTFTPQEECWELPGGRVCDPFRPRIEPEGFASVQEMRQDRDRHLQAVRRMFEELDVFVFTLGLTECWISKVDGAAFPLAPGVAGGRFDPERHAFVNLGVEEVTADLRAFIGKLRGVNPKARLLFTVSPVPLAATYADDHVLAATTWSKSVLRVAAESVRRGFPDVCYFPSYEIITGAYSRGRYFGQDLRSVTEEGVGHVMGVFMHRMAGAAAPQPPAEDDDADAQLAEMEKLADAVCEEILLARR